MSTPPDRPPGALHLPTRARTTALRALLAVAVAVAVGLTRLASPVPAHAHDANLARWDLVVAPSGELALRLRTSGSGLHHSVVAWAPDLQGKPAPPEVYARQVEAFARDVVVVEEAGERLELTSATLTNGHESKLNLRFQRQSTTASGPLRVDLSRYSARPGQHHLVFVHEGTTRHRTMLKPGGGHVLLWAPGVSRDTPADPAVRSSPGSRSED